MVPVRFQEHSWLSVVDEPGVHRWEEGVREESSSGDAGA